MEWMRLVALLFHPQSSHSHSAQTSSVSQPHFQGPLSLHLAQADAVGCSPLLKALT